MFRRTLNLVLFFFSLQGHTQVIFENGEVNLRGTLIFKNEKDARLVVNAGTRSMKSFSVSTKEFAKVVKPFKSGTKVEACLNISLDSKKNNTPAELVKIRPLGPTEAVFLYSGTIKSCPVNKGCKNFDKAMEAPLLSDSISAADMSEDYFSCQK